MTISTLPRICMGPCKLGKDEKQYGFTHLNHMKKSEGHLSKVESSTRHARQGEGAEAKRRSPVCYPSGPTSPGASERQMLEGLSH